MTWFGLTVYREFDGMDKHCQPKICKFESKVLERIIIIGNLFIVLVEEVEN